MEKYYHVDDIVGIDTETTGLQGQINTIQVGRKDGEPTIIRPYKNVQKAVKFLKILYDPQKVVLGYNLGFDLVRLYAMAHAIYSKLGINDGIPYSGSATFDPGDFKGLFTPGTFKPFVYPFQAKFIDLMLHVKTDSKYAPYALSLADESSGRGRNKSNARCISRLKGIHVSVRDNVAQRVISLLDLPKGVEVGTSYERCKSNPDFYDIKFILSLNASLKRMISNISGGSESEHLDDFGWNMVRDEKEFDPFDGYVNDETIRLYRENEKIVETSKIFEKYAKNDIRYLFQLDDFLGHPKQNDNDKVMAIVAYTRYHGITLDVEGCRGYIKDLETKIDAIKGQYAIDLASPPQRLEYIRSLGFDVSSSSAKVIKKLLTDLEIQKKMTDDGFDLDLPSTDAVRVNLSNLAEYNALEQRVRQARKMIGSCTERLHPDFNVIGAASGRMSGKGGFNTQGISKDSDGIRKFVLCSCGGDYSGQELSVAAAVYGDEQMTKDLEEKYDLHSKMITYVLPDLSYDEIVKAKKDKNHPKHELVEGLRNKVGKTSNFSILYGGGEFRIQGILRDAGILECEKLAHEMYEGFKDRYKGFRRFTDELHKKYVTLEEVYEMGEWSRKDAAIDEMETSVVSDLGFARHFAFEKQLIDIFSSGKVHTGLPKYFEKIVRYDEKGKEIKGDELEKIKEQESEDAAEDTDEDGESDDFDVDDPNDPDVSAKVVVHGKKEEKIDKYTKKIVYEKVTRSKMKGPQYLDQSVNSSCLGAALSIQRAILRQATNHKVQSFGAGLTKKLMIAIFEAHMVPLVNVHDEVVIPIVPDEYDDIKRTVDHEISNQGRLVKTIKMDFAKITRWCEKG